MKRYGNLIWEGVSTEPKPGISDGAGDGHIMKELDTGDTYERRSGVWINVSSGFSFIRATKSGRITTNANGDYHVTFVTPLINSLYSVVLATDDSGGTQPTLAFYSNLSTTGFDIKTRYSRTGNPRGNVVVSWLATRDFNP